MFGPVSFGNKPAVAERFGRIARSICGQQLSVAAARTIHGRVCDLLGEISPATILATAPEDLRGCGLSNAKVAALMDLSEKVTTGALNLGRLGRISETDAVAQLTQVRGIGEWTAQMFLLGSLHRLDVWPTGDAGVRNGYALVADLATVPTADELEPMGDAYRPYRSIAAWYCWQLLDNAPG